MTASQPQERTPVVLRVSKRIAPTPGGLEQHARQLAENQSALGALNLVVFGRGDLPILPHACYQRLPDTSVLPGDIVKGAAFSATVLVQRSSWSRCLQVVHTHGSAGDLLAAVALKAVGRKIFHTFHGTLALPLHIRLIYRACLPLFDGIFVVSGIISDQLRDLNCNLPPIHVLTSGIDDAFFAVESEATSRSALMVGRLSPVKGFDVGLHAARSLLNKGLIDKVEIAGDGPEREKLMSVAREVGVPITFHGMLPKEKLPELMQRAAVVLVPSRTLSGQAEGSPTSILESWAAGVPVACSRSGGIPYLVRDGVDAVLADEGDPTGLAKAAEIAITNRPRLVAAGKIRVDGYTWRALASRILDIYGINK